MFSYNGNESCKDDFDQLIQNYYPFDTSIPVSFIEVAGNTSTYKF